MKLVFWGGIGGAVRGFLGASCEVGADGFVGVCFLGLWESYIRALIYNSDAILDCENTIK